MNKKLVVVAHGIGDHPEGFFKEWEETLHANHPKGKFTVTGLCWEDILEKAEKKYPWYSTQAATAFKKLGFGALESMLDSAIYQKVSDSAMDILTYVALGDMNRFMRAQCAIRLEELRISNKAAEEDVVLLGHSLGAAMLPHIVWDYYRRGGGDIPWHGLILLASPLGYQSPFPDKILDPMGLMLDKLAPCRTDVLREFSMAWRRRGKDRLHFLINQRDLVCWDAEFDKVGDPLPGVWQGFAAQEMEALSAANPTCLHLFAEGRTALTQIAANHSLQLYLNRPEFKQAFNGLLKI